MNKKILVFQTLFSVGFGGMVNFFILRSIIRKINWPEDKRLQVRLAAVLAVLLAVPSLVRNRQLSALEEANTAQSHAAS